MLHRQGRLNPQRVRHHHATDLLTFVKECQTKGELAVVVGDFNEVIGLDLTGLTRLCSECGLKDTMRSIHDLPD